MKPLVLLYGPPAAGKRTLGHELVRRTALSLVENQLTVRLARQFFESGTDACFAFSAALRRVVLEHLAQSDAHSGVVLTYCYWGTSNDFLRFVDRHFAVFPIRLLCPFDELRRRVESDERAALGKIASIAKLEELRRNVDLDAVIPQTRLVVDTSKESVRSCADRVLRLLAMGGRGTGSHQASTNDPLATTPG